MTNELTQLMLADIKRSGIPRSLIPKLGFKPLNKYQSFDYLFPGKKLTRRFSAWAYAIPYFDHRGRPLKDGFQRLRLLKGKWKNESKFGRGKDKVRNDFKYNQRANTIPHIYFPPVIEWPRTKRLIKIKRLVITEGEKKAVKAGLCGIHCIALGGVSSYQSKKLQIDLLEEFDLFDFSETRIELCYDSDLIHNENVRIAMDGLAAKLSRLNPESIKIVRLAGNATGKAGLDDFLAQFKTPDDARIEFNKLPREAEARSGALAALNEEFRYSVEEQSVYSLKTRCYYTPQQLYVYRGNLPEVPDPKNPRLTIPQVTLWLQQRTEQTNVASVVYEPGKEQEFEENGKRFANSWKPANCAPKMGNAKHWLELVRDHVCSTLTEDQKDWLMQWFAYPLQHIGTKLHSSVFMFSYKGGIGKNLMIEPFAKIYGENYKRIDGGTIADGYNSWATQSQFVFADEVYVSSNRAERNAAMNKLKSLITNHELDHNEKYIKRGWKPSRANYFLASNHGDAVPIDLGDRRQFIIHAIEKELSQAQSTRLREWVAEDGAQVIYSYLLNLDLAEFNPHGHAPHTAARDEVIALSSDTTTNLVQIIKEQPETIFSKDGITSVEKELYTAEECLLAAHEYQQKFGARLYVSHPRAFGVMLTKQGIHSEHRTVRVGGNVRTVTLYSIFNPAQWAKREWPEWLAHYTDNTRNNLILPNKEIETPKTNVVTFTRNRKRDE